MKKHRSLLARSWKALAIAAAVAAWASIPLFSGSVEAGGGVPILVRTAFLASPTGSVNPHGAAEYQLYANGHRELEVEIEDVSLPAGTALAAIVDGNSVGSIILAADQRGRLKLRTEDGQNVPVTNDGSTVEVRNGASVLVAGILGGGGPNPGPTASPTASPTGSPNGTPSPSPTSSPGGTPSPSPTSSPNPGNLFAGLTGPTLNGVLPGGYAEFEIHSSRVELEVRLSRVNLAIGTPLAIVVDGTQAGTLFLESGGEGRLRLRSDDGQTVPPVISGSTISVLNGGSQILSGIFAGMTGPSPSPTPTGTPGPTPSPSPSLGRSFEVHLTGSGVNPPVTTGATGEFKITLNATETQATIFGEFHGLGSSQTGARIETTVGTPVVVHSFPVLGGTNGNFSSVTVDVSAALVQQLRTGLWSAVISSANFPGGEIAGMVRQRSGESDFDGDGGNDLAVFRPSTSVWYAMNSSGFATQTFGTASDKIVSGDYDGDGRTDAAVYKNVNGAGIWEIRRSSDGGITAAQFGTATDVPARGDFDGDGRQDLAVYRPETGVWYVQKSNNTGFAIVRFGLAEDKPVPMDADGDGRDDIAVFRPSTGTWYWLRSSDGQFGAVQFGMNGDVPVRGDMDGDGKDDISVFRPSTGVWYVFRSTDHGFHAVQWGTAGDIPAAGSYDNDNKADLAVFRPSTGFWYILRSSDLTFQAVQFGLNGDIPVGTR